MCTYYLIALDGNLLLEFNLTLGGVVDFLCNYHPHGRNGLMIVPYSRRFKDRSAATLFVERHFLFF